MKKRMNKFSQKAVAFLLLLTYILILMPTFTVSAARATKYAVPTVSLTRKASESAEQAEFLLTLSGKAMGDVKVHVKTFDISAKAGVDYGSVDLTVTLNEEKPTFTIGTPIGINQDAVGFKNGNDVYTDFFGITIVSVTNAVPDSEHNTLFVQINHKMTLDIKTNRSMSGNGSNDGYSFSVAGEVIEKNDTLWKDMGGGWALEPVSKNAEITPLFLQNSTLHETLANRYNDNKNIFLYYAPEDVLAFTGSFRATYQHETEDREASASSWLRLETGLSVDSYLLSLYLEHEHSYDFNFFEDSDDFPSSAITISSRNGKTKFLRLNGKTDAYIKFVPDYYFGGFETALSNIKIYTTIIDTVAPTVTGYRLVNASTYEGGNVYIAVDFSEPVQLVDSKLRLNITLGGKEYALKCVENKFSKTLLFAFDEDDNPFNGSFVSSGDLTIKGFNQTTGIADMLWNTENKNNVCELPTSLNETHDIGDIDTRTPQFSNEECLSANKKAQAHSVSVELSGMDTDGKLYYAWTESSSVSSVTEWKEHASFLIGRNTFTEYGLHGDYYLHLKAVGANGVTAYWTYGALTFDNMPTVKALTYEAEHKLQPSHAVPIETTLTDKLYYAWSVSSLADNVTNWTEKTDFVGGVNTIYGGSMNGNYYLHVKAVNSYGFETTWASEDAYQFDGLPPVALDLTCDTATNALPEHTVNIKMQETGFDDIKYAYLYVVDENGTMLVNGRTVYGAENRSDNILSFSGLNGTITLTYKTIGMPANTSAKYKIGFVFEDAHGNKTTEDAIVYSPFILFDSHGEFEVDVLEDPKTEIETVKGYEVLLSGEGKKYEFQFKLDTPYAAGDRMGVTMITHNGKEIFELDEDYSGTDPYTDGFGKKTGTDYGIVSITYNPERQSVTIEVSGDAKGYYEISFFYNEKKAIDFPVYFTTENDMPNNFYAISEEGLLSNRVWTFANKRFYRFISSQNEATEALTYEITSNRYAESGAAPIFSDKEKAYEYALFMELQDVALVYLGPKATSTVNLLNGGTSGHFKKAIGETATAATGQTWIRYKNTVWDSSQTPNAQDYAYYFYSNTQETSLDYTKVMSMLIGEALEKHAKAISNYDEGEWLYLTMNTGEVDGNGEPNYRKDAVFDKSLIYKGPFSEEITYEGDSEIYSTTISGIHGYSEIDEAYLLANYTFSSDGGRTVVYYREYNGTGNVGAYTEVAVEKGRSVNLKNLVSKTGVYEFIEFDGNGSRKFFVYADFYAPTLRYEYTQSGKNNSGYIDRFVSGSTIRAGSVTLLEFVTEAGGYTPEYDEHAYFYVTNTSGKVIAFMTAKELKASGGYSLTEDTVIVYLCDRLGNVTSVTIRANESDLYATATIKDDEALILTINRTEDVIAIEGFRIYKDNVVLDVDFSQTLTFYESGKYTIELADIYGNTFTETYTFQRPLPVVEFQCKDEKGDYVPMGNDVSGSAYVVSLGNNAYQVTASSEIRLKYDADAEYEFTVISGNPVLKHTRSGAQYVRIIDNSTTWMIKISHKRDPSTYILVTCAHDIVPPEVHVRASTQEFRMNELNDLGNVLFTAKNNKNVVVENGQTVNCYKATIDWSDENEIRSVTFMKDGKIVPLTQAQLMAKFFDISGFGEYKITVTDILNNATTFTFRIANEIGLDYYIDGEKTAYSMDPASLITNGKYGDTQYTSKEVKLVLTEFGTVSFLYQNETESGIYQIRYLAEGLTLYYLNNRTYQQIQTVNAAAGELFVNYAHDFTMKYEIKDGKLSLILPTPDEGYEFWQFRVTDLENTSPSVIQIERSDRSPSVRFIEIETEELIETNENNEEVYTGAKSAVKIYEPSITDAIVKVSVFYSEKETFDFYRKKESILFGEGQNLSEIKDEGYYKIVTSDVYGNEQIVYLRIGFGFEAAVKIIYQTLETVEFSVDKSGSFDAKSNHSVQFTIWAERDSCTVTAEKNGAEYALQAKSSRKDFTFTIEGVGEYKILVDDGCGNVLNFSVSIKAPTEIEYHDYLTGFNEDAPYRDKLYTNGKVNIDYDRFVDDGIRYIYYRVTQEGETSVKHILYNLLVPNPAEYKEEDFKACIGKEGNGAYEIVFADEYGNYVTKTVRISDGGQLTVSRLTESSGTPELLDMGRVLSGGAWSNRSVILGDNAEASVLKVDGETVSFTDGEYMLTFPPAFAEGYETHEVDYMDEYGNRYRFTVHLQKQVIEVTFLSDAELVTVGDQQYVKGNFSYLWTDPKVTAHYSLGSLTASYDNGQVLSENGKYVLTFVDYAGNSTSKTITLDTVVSYKIIVGHNRMPSGIATNEHLTLSGDGETLNIVSVKRDGAEIETANLSFTEHGMYEVELSDIVGNTATVEFAIFTHAVKELDYFAEPGFSIAGVWMIDGADRLSFVSQIAVDENGTQFVSLTQSGEYDVELKDLLSGAIYSFRTEIDHTPPNVTLVGVEEGGSTREDVTVMGILKGDHVDVYRGTELIFTKTAAKDVDDPPTIGEPGDYKIVVSDEAGNVVEYEFTREFTSNAASNIIILMLLFLVGVSGFVFLIVNGKAKVR